MRSGIAGIVRRLCVTSSPTSPLPRVAQRDRQPVDLRLGDELEARILDSLAREVVAHALDPGAQLLLRARVGEREHRLQVADLLEPAHRLGADALRRRVGRDELRALGLQRAQLVEQLVVLLVADDRVVEHVVAVPVVGELAAQLLDALDHVHAATLRTAAASSSAISSGPRSSPSTTTISAKRAAAAR
jgi:hypothetical protein